MAQVSIRYNLAEYVRIRTDSKVLDDLRERAQRIADACNAESSWGGYYSAASIEGTRARAGVWSIGPKAALDNSRNQRILKNLDAGR